MKFNVLLFFLVFGFVISVQAEKTNSLTVQNGVLNIGSSSILQNNILKLQGNCEFYWNELLDPNDFKDSLTVRRTQFVSIPKSWTSYKIDGKNLSNKGYATYRLTICKSADSTQELYGLKLSSIFSSYKLWVNGALVAEVGRVGKTEESSQAAFKYHDLPLIVGNAETLEIIIQVSNFKHQRGGLHIPIYFGKYENLTASTRWADILNLIIIGIVLLIGINHLSLYLLRREDKSNLYFSIVCLVMILRNISTGDRIIAYVFPNIDWELLFKLDNLSGFATIPLFALFIYDLFKQDFSKKLMRAYVYIGVAVSFLVVFTNANFYGKFRTLFELYVLLGGLYLTFGILLKATLKRRPYAAYTFAGMFILYATAINDVLSSMGIIQTAYIAPYGLVSFMLLQSISINLKSARAISRNEVLGAQLLQEKANLEIRIGERTKELQQQHAALLQHQEKEKLQNWVNHGVASLNEVIGKNKDNYHSLCKGVLSALVKYIDAKAGAFYIATTENESTALHLIADYGLSKKAKQQNAIIEPNNGLVGATYTLNEAQLITNIPSNYLSINSGLGNASPKSLLLVPLCFDNTVLGVIELASFKQITDTEIEFVKKIADNVANNINTVIINEQNVSLIQQFKENARQMEENQDRMRQSLEELEIMREQAELPKSSN